MSDTLRALLGDKYDDVIQQALAAVDTPHHGYQVTRGNVDGRDVDAALSAVLPDLLAAAWGERDALAAKLDSAASEIRQQEGETND